MPATPARSRVKTIRRGDSCPQVRRSARCEFIASANQPHARRARRRLHARWASSSSAAASRSTTITRAVANFKVAIPSWGVGTGGTRFGRFPGTRRAAQCLREARRLRRHPQADRRHAHGLAAHSLGPHRRLQGAARTRRRAGSRLRRHELEHLPGSGRASRCRTSTAASRTPMPPCARRPSRTTSTASRPARPSARRR